MNDRERNRYIVDSSMSRDYTARILFHRHVAEGRHIRVVVDQITIAIVRDDGSLVNLRYVRGSHHLFHLVLGQSSSHSFAPFADDEVVSQRRTKDGLPETLGPVEIDLKAHVQATRDSHGGIQCTFWSSSCCVVAQDDGAHAIPSTAEYLMFAEALPYRQCGLVRIRPSGACERIPSSNGKVHESSRNHDDHRRAFLVPPIDKIAHKLFVRASVQAMQYHVQRRFKTVVAVRKTDIQSYGLTIGNLQPQAVIHNLGRSIQHEW